VQLLLLLPRPTLYIPKHYPSCSRAPCRSVCSSIHSLLSPPSFVSIKGKLAPVAPRCTLQLNNAFLEQECRASTVLGKPLAKQDLLYALHLLQVVVPGRLIQPI
jgi:hypothetical protein